MATSISSKSINPAYARKAAKLFIKKDNAYATLHLSAHLIILFTLSFIAYNTTNFYLLILLVWINGFIYSFLGTTGATHEFYHGTVFTSKKLNKFFYQLMCFLSYTNPVKFEVTHSLHHRCYRSALDSEGYSNSHAGLNVLDYMNLWLIDLPKIFKITRSIYPTLLSSISSPNLRTLLGESSGNCESFIRTSQYHIIGHFCLVMVFILCGKPLFILFVTIAPFVCTFPSRYLASLQHIDYDSVPSKDLLETTLSCNIPLILSLLYWNMNFHLEHHLSPAVPFYNLKKFSFFLKNSSHHTISSNPRLKL